MIFLYFMIGLLASTIGAIAGIGGGVFMKPILDFLGHYPIGTIGVLSSTTVLGMSTVSLWTKRRDLKTMDKIQAILLASGSVIGGLLGKSIFTSLLAYGWVGVIQTSFLIIIFSAVFVYVQYKDKFPSYHIENKGIILLVGLLLGLLPAFLDIGGGPHNIAILSLLFALDTKKAGLYSIFIIFFSQLSSLFITSVTVDLGSYNLTMLPGMVIGGILGGLIGSRLAKWLSIEQVDLIFKLIIISLLILNLYNLIVAL